MAFFEELFPPRYSANAQAVPRFINEKAYTASGRRSTNRLAELPLYDYIIDHPVREAQDFEELRSFFWVVGGDADGFRFKDWSDYLLTPENSRLAPVSGATWQVQRVYKFGSRSCYRPIFKPVEGVVVTRIRGGTPSIVETAVDSTSGLCEISGHIDGDTYTSEGQFHVPVAFKDPKAVWRFLGGSRGLTEWAGIDLEEFRL